MKGNMDMGKEMGEIGGKRVGERERKLTRNTDSFPQALIF